VPILLPGENPIAATQATHFFCPSNPVLLEKPSILLRINNRKLFERDDQPTTQLWLDMTGVMNEETPSDSAGFPSRVQRMGNRKIIKYQK